MAEPEPIEILGAGRRAGPLPSCWHGPAAVQERFWALGIRAMTTGHLAAREILAGDHHEQAVRRQLQPLLSRLDRHSRVHELIYRAFGCGQAGPRALADVPALS